MSSVKLFVLSTLLSVTSAHLGLFNAAGIYPPKDGVQFGGKFDPGYTPAIPLGKDNSIKPPPNGFWFHGADINKAKAQGGNDPSKGTQLALQAGGSVTLEVACNKKWTSMGNGHNPNGDACPDGQELWKSRHVNPDPSREVYLGCGLGIAYKSPNEVTDLDQIKAKDITIFSVVNDCVKKKDVTFQIPKDMPPCPPGGCICSWFWQGQESADEMYMTGFFCDVKGGNINAKPGTPQPAKFCGGGNGCVEGPKQPLIWANEDPKHPNNVQKAGSKKPAYTPEWGFKDGAQPVTGGATSGGNTEETPSKSFQSPSRAPLLATKGKDNARHGDFGIQSTDDCEWPGHCYGAPCSNHNDCSDPWFCGAQGTCTGGSSKFRRSIVDKL